MPVAIFVATFNALFVALFAVLVGKASKEAEEHARMRRTTDNQMNARLQKFNV